MTSPTSKRPTKEKLQAMAEAVRKELQEFRDQDAVYKLAVEAGYLAAKADGTVDEDEKKRIVEAVDILSQGVVIELEVDSIIEEVDGSGQDVAERAVSLGKRLAELKQGDAGLLFGAFVAQASHGIDGDERKVLREVGKAAGVKARRIRTILKVVGDEPPEAFGED
jgi:tellurite resistance protein